MEIRQISPGVYEINLGERRMLATLNLTPGRNVYGEQLVDVGGEEYREWIPYRSKMAAVILRGVRDLPLAPGHKVLYLGVASGTTCSHVSDIVGSRGHVWGVDFAPRPLRDLIENLSRYRKNISPILGDARRPDSYSALVPKVDFLYADVAQPDQANIVVKNADLFLKQSGWAMMAIKSRSVDVTRPPGEIYDEQAEVLRAGGFEVLKSVDLEPYEKDHAMVVARCAG